MVSDYKSLYDILADHADRLCDKWEHYPNIYEAEIGPRVKLGRPLRLLEIGVQNGGSLEVWRKYLPAGSTIVGVDINDRCGQLSFPDDISFLLGSATDPSLISRLPEPEFDIIVDDGSHRSADVVNAFALLFEKLAPGGCYIVEDIETSYSLDWGGGFRLPHSSIEWAKGFVDALNVFHISEADRAKAPDGVPLREIGRKLWSLTFYDAVIVFKKLGSTRELPYRRIFSGRSASIMDPLDWIPYVAAETFADIGMNQHSYRRIELALVQRIKAFSEKHEDLKSELNLIRGRLGLLESRLSDET